VLYQDEDEESVGSEPETRESKLQENPRPRSSSLELISAIDDDSGEVVGRYGVDIPKGNGVGNLVVLRPQYGERSGPVSTASSEVVPTGCFLGMSRVGSDPSRKYRLTGEGEVGGDAKGEGRGVSCGDFGTFGNLASLSANSPPPCTEVLRGTSRIFPSSTQNSQGQSLSLPLAVG